MLVIMQEIFHVDSTVKHAISRHVPNALPGSLSIAKTAVNVHARLGNGKEKLMLALRAYVSI